MANYQELFNFIANVFGNTPTNDEMNTVIHIVNKNHSKGLTANDYQKAANRTLIDKPDFEITEKQSCISEDAIEIIRHSGRVAELIKKGIFHQKGLNNTKLINSLDAIIENSNDAKESVRIGRAMQLTDQEVMLVWNIFGLTGEAGEVTELVYDFIYESNNPIDKEKAKKELGDVLWYVAALAKLFGLTLEEIMQHNIDKLKARYPDGYKAERSNFKEGEAS